MVSLRTFDKAILGALVVVFAVLCGDFILGSWRTIFDSTSVADVQVSDQAFYQIDEKLSHYNLDEPSYEGSNKEVSHEIIKIVKNESDILGLEFQNTIINQTASLLKNPEIPIAPVVSSVRSELAALYDTLLERGFRQRHTVQSLQSDFRARSNRAVLDKNIRSLDGFDKLIKDFEKGVHASPMRMDYKERVDGHVAAILSSLNEISDLKIDQNLFNQAVTNIRTALLDERTALSLRANTERRQLLESMNYVRKRAYVYLAFAGVLFATFLVGYIRVITTRAFSFTEMKNRFKERERKLHLTKQKIDLIKDSSVLILAIVKPTGQIVWSSKGFRLLFNRKSLRESGWKHIKSNCLTQISEMSRIPGSYRLRNKPDSEFMISESKLSNSSFSLVVIREMKSYFSELSEAKSIRGSVLSYSEKTEGVFFVDQVVEDILLSSSNFMKNLDVSLAYEGRLPQPVKGETAPIAQVLSSFLELISQGTNLFGEKIKLDLDYETKGNGLSLRFNIHNFNLDQRGITAPLGVRGRYGNVWECLTELEEKFKNYGIEIALRNIVKKGSLEENRIVQFEVSFQTLSLAIEKDLDIVIAPSSIRARPPEVVV